MIFVQVKSPKNFDFTGALPAKIAANSYICAKGMDKFRF